MESNREIGNIGEDLASEIVVSLGYLVLDRNYLRKTGKIDIICLKNNKIVFFEVKTILINHISGVTREIYYPENNISKTKIQKINKTASYYLSEKHINDQYFEISSISIFLDTDLKLLNYSIINNINII